MFKLNVYVEQIIQTLLEFKIDYACLAPGSRSTPFAQALAREELIDDFVHFDERSLAFHALGYARGSKKCAPIFITSGSSLANLFPAVVEASQDQIPMLIFSADRPVELRACSSNQTLDQAKFFHQYARWQQDIPLYDPDLPSLYIPSVVRQALYQAQKGVVHLNCQFREPFFEKDANSSPSSKSLMRRSYPIKSAVEKRLLHPPTLASSNKGLILCGRKTSEEDFKSIHAFAKQYQWPIFADVLSFGRWGSFSNTFSYYELLLEAYPQLSFDTILHFGGPLTSKTLLNWLKRCPPKEYHLIHEEDKIVDPNRLPHFHHPLSAVEFCRSLTHLNPSSASLNLSTLIEMHQQIEESIHEELEDFSEQSLVYHLIKSYPQKRIFFSGASLPIRHLSLFTQSEHEHQVFSNRGASGIDGNLSTAFGLSQALDQPLTLLVGDLTFLYDVGALAQIRFLKHPIDLIVLNNSGGGIFSYLPIREDQTAHQRYFQTPHSFNLSHITQAFGIEAFQPKDLEAFKTLLASCPSSSRLIELCVDSSTAYQKHQSLLQSCKACFSHATTTNQVLL